MNGMVLLTKALEPFVYSTLRHWVGWLGGIMVGIGMVSTDQRTQFTGLALALGMWFWSVIEKIAAIGIRAELENLRAALQGIAPAALRSADPPLIPTIQPTTFNRGASEDMKVSPVMNKVTLALLVLMCLVVGTIQAYAADVAPPAAKGAAAPAPVGCTVSSCTGWTVGGNIIGAGTSSDVGVSAASLAAGGMLGAQFGWQTWNGSLLLGVEVTGDYDATGTSGGKPGYYFSQMVKVGGAVNGFFTGVVSPAQGPLQIGGATALAPYFQAGAVERPFGVGWATGLGTEFALGGPWMADLSYVHVVYNATVNPALTVRTDDLIKLGINRKFP
jgi:hypothetical protein